MECVWVRGSHLSVCPPVCLAVFCWVSWGFLLAEQTSSWDISQSSIWEKTYRCSKEIQNSVLLQIFIHNLSWYTAYNSHGLAFKPNISQTEYHSWDSAIDHWALYSVLVAQYYYTVYSLLYYTVLQFTWIKTLHSQWSVPRKKWHRWGTTVHQWW